MAANLQEGVQVVLCEMCPEEDRKPARKTCMKCEISMCVQHLQAHLTTPVLLQTHPLTEPMNFGGACKCLEHGKLLEYYCLDDLTCVCVSCAIEDQHRLHNMKTFPAAHKELTEKLQADEIALMVKSDDDNMSLEKWEVSERERLSTCSQRLIESINHLQDIALTKVQTSVAARMVSIKTSKSSVEAAKKETDTFRFLKMYSQVNQHVKEAKALDFRKGLEPGSERDKLVEQLMQKCEEMLAQADRLWYSLLTVVDPENHQIYNSDSEMIFVPMVKGPSVSLSEDKRTLFFHTWIGQCSAVLQLHNEKPAGNLQRWMVKLSLGCDWAIGVCDKQSLNSLEVSNSYSLCYEDKKLSWQPANNTDQISDVVTEGTLTVEVCWNVTAHSLAFFSRPGQQRRKEIITIEMDSKKQDLVPFIRIQEKLKRNEPGISMKFGGEQMSCSCGRNYRNDRSGFSFRKACCFCESNICPTTIIVCELQ